MRFLVDENVRIEVDGFLRAADHDVLRTPSGLADEAVIRLAKREGRILLTHDAEFANVLRYPPGAHAGIIRLKFHPPTLDVILRHLTTFLQTVPPAECSKALFVLERGGFRKRT